MFYEFIKCFGGKISNKKSVITKCTELLSTAGANNTLKLAQLFLVLIYLSILVVIMLILASTWSGECVFLRWFRDISSIATVLRTSSCISTLSPAGGTVIQYIAQFCGACSDMLEDEVKVSWWIRSGTWYPTWNIHNNSNFINFWDAHFRNIKTVKHALP